MAYFCCDPALFMFAYNGGVASLSGANFTTSSIMCIFLIFHAYNENLSLEVKISIRILLNKTYLIDLFDLF